MEEFQTSNLTYWDVSQQTYLYVQTLLASWVWSEGKILQWGGGDKIAKWVWAKGDIYPFNEGGDGGERGSGQITHELF